jgi:SsrA-binding protein
MASVATKRIADNRKARFDYELLEHFEAGIVLQGTEVKSLRAGKLNLGDSYCVIERDGQVYLKDAHISPYSHGTHANHDPLRTRKLLLNRGEIRRLAQRVREKGLTLIPTRVYLKNGWVKVEIALAKGRKKYDKREKIKERDAERDTQRHLA